MINNFMIAAVIVVVLWIIILAVYFVVTRRQPQVQAQMKALEEQLDKTEREAGNQ